MGCTCSFLKKNNNEEMMNDFVKRVEDISKDENKMNSVIKIQRNYRIKLIRSKLRSNQLNNNKITNTYSQVNPTLTSSRIPNNEIQEEELETLFKEYPPLNDGVILRVNGPIRDPITHSIYLGEWDFSKNVKHGRGIQLWEEGAEYSGYFTQNKANIKGKLKHSDGDIYEGEWLNDKPNGKGKYMKEIGKKINNMEKEKRFGRMVLLMKGII